MIPIGDTIRAWRRPYVNWLIIGVTFAAFLFELSLGPRLDSFVHRWGVVPLQVSQALSWDPRVPHAALWTLVTATFLHAGWFHLGSNLLFLWVFGDNVEDRLGHVRYLFFYLLWGAAGSLAQVGVMPDSRVPLIGASGAIAGVLGAYLVMYPRAWVTVLIPVFVILLPIEVPALLMLGLWFASQLVSGLASITEASTASGGVGWWAHIGGFALGALLTPFLPKTPDLGRRRPSTLGLTRPEVEQSGILCFTMRVVSLLGDAVGLLILVRVVVQFLGLGSTGMVGAIVRLVYTVTWPLVEPFGQWIPAWRLNGFVLEVYSLAALACYYLLVALLIWFLGLLPGGPCSQRRPIE